MAHPLMPLVDGARCEVCMNFTYSEGCKSFSFYNPGGAEPPCARARAALSFFLVKSRGVYGGVGAFRRTAGYRAWKYRKGSSTADVEG